MAKQAYVPDEAKSREGRDKGGRERRGHGPRNRRVNKGSQANPKVNGHEVYPASKYIGKDVERVPAVLWRPAVHTLDQAFRYPDDEYWERYENGTLDPSVWFPEYMVPQRRTPEEHEAHMASLMSRREADEKGIILDESRWDPATSKRFQKIKDRRYCKSKANEFAHKILQEIHDTGLLDRHYLTMKEVGCVLFYFLDGVLPMALPYYYYQYVPYEERSRVVSYPSVCRIIDQMKWLSPTLKRHLWFRGWVGQFVTVLGPWYKDAMAFIHPSQMKAMRAAQIRAREYWKNKNQERIERGDEPVEVAKFFRFNGEKYFHNLYHYKKWLDRRDTWLAHNTNQDTTSKP